MSLIIIINLKNFSFFFQDNKVHRRHFSSVVTTRVQKMSHALMYLYLNPSCAKAGEVVLQGLMYKLILLMMTTMHSSVHHFTRGLLVSL